MLKRLLVLLLGLGGIGFILGTVAAIQLGEPELPEPELSSEDYADLLRHTSKITNAQPRPATIKLTLPQATFLLQQVSIEKKWFGWSVTNVALQESGGEHVELHAVLKGPMGLYSTVILTGTLRLEEGNWVMEIAEARMGSLPLTMVVPKEWGVDLPTEFLDGRLKLVEVRVDGSGVKAQAKLLDELPEAPTLKKKPEEDPIRDLLE